MPVIISRTWAKGFSLSPQRGASRGEGRECNQRLDDSLIAGFSLTAPASPPAPLQSDWRGWRRTLPSLSGSGEGILSTADSQIWEAGVRFSKMLMILETLSLYCGSLLNFFQTGESENPFQCFLCSSRFSPDTM